MPYREYFKSAADALIIVDSRGQILEVNPRTERLFGYRPDQLVGHPVDTLLPERLRTHHAKHLKEYFGAPRSRPMGIGLALAGRRKDGSEFPIEVSLMYARGTSRGDLVVAAVSDITERLRLEHFVHRSETLGSLGMIAHELNQPLSAILSNAEVALQLLTSDAPDLEELKAILNDIIADDVRATEIMRSVRGLFEGDQAAESRVDLEEILRTIDRTVGTELANKGIRLRIDTAPGLPSIVANRTQLAQAVTNLVINAAEAVADLGPSDRSVEVHAISDDQGDLRVTIRDRGAGIPPAVLPRIFDAFFTTKRKGLGLGLALTRSIIERHGGRIWAENEETGASLTFMLPTR